MEFVTAIGAFEADLHPETEDAVVVRSRDPRALEALRHEVLPDLEILGDVAVVSSDEWCHALRTLEDRA